MTRRLVALGAAIVWLAIVAVIAFGSAGLVTGLDHPPGSSGRPDVVAPGDAEVGPLLDAAQADLDAVAAHVDSLGTTARGALAALNGNDLTSVEASLRLGDALVVDIDRAMARLRADLAAVPYIGTPMVALELSDPVISRHAALVEALDTTDGLDAAWRRLSQGSIAAARMSELLAEHDRVVTLAAESGRKARYDDALTYLDQADQAIADARALRDRLVSTVDVTVLDEWLSRNEAYDVALRNLYKAISTVRGKVTNDVRDAIKAEAEARQRLPPDNRGLVIIMSEIGRTGMNGAVIAIEEARGRLAAAISALEPAAVDDAAPGASGSPAP